jgi:hypothetical protein
MPSKKGRPLNRKHAKNWLNCACSFVILNSGERLNCFFKFRQSIMEIFTERESGKEQIHTLVEFELKEQNMKVEYDGKRASPPKRLYDSILTQ